MIRTDEDALVCDLAETYHIYNYRQLPARQVAVFAFGLRDDARIKLIMAGQVLPTESLLLAGVLDRLSLLVWSKTKEAQKGGKPPAGVLEGLVHRTAERKELSFKSGEEFERARRALLGEEGGEGNGD